MANKPTEPENDLQRRAREMYEKGDDFTKAAIAAGDIATASKFMNPNSDADEPQPVASAKGLGRENDIKERKFNQAVYTNGSTRDPNARVTPVTMFAQDKATGNLKYMAVRPDAMSYAADHVDLPAGTAPAELLKGAKQFYFESGLRDEQLFNKYMAGDKAAHDSLQKVLTNLDPKTEAAAWGRDTWAELEQNRQQYAATTASITPVTVAPATKPATPKMGK